MQRIVQRDVVRAEKAPVTFVRLELGTALAEEGKFQEAFAQFPDAIDAEAGLDMAIVARAHARGGDSAVARSIFQRLEARAQERYISPYALGIAASALGDQPRALDYLEAGLRERAVALVFLRWRPGYDSVRNHPRFLRVLNQVERKY